MNMAEPSNEAASSSSVSEQAASVAPMRDELEKVEDFLEPDKKRRKQVRGDGKTEQKLEHRLGGILCCAVCLDLPRAAVYQCTNGHLMCAGCFTHVLADARLRDELATCPNCRIEISKTSASRNLAVEKAVSELPAECQYCAKEFPRNSLERHEETMCEERISSCKYSRIGCPWRGPNHEGPEHEAHCVHPHRTGADVMEALRDIDARTLEERRLYDNVFDLLSYEKITFNDLQMKPYRTDEFVHKLFYETSRFTAFNNQWVVKARINNSQRDPTQSSERDITYQLILKTKTTYPLPLHYLILKGPFGDMKVQPRIHRFEFTEQDNESPYLPIPLPDTAECNRLLAAKAISFRQLTDSATGKGSQKQITDLWKKLFLSVRNVKKENMSMQNHSKLFAQIKDYLNKFGYEKNLQMILSKYWIELVQKIAYIQGDTIRKLLFIGAQKQSDKIIKEEKSNFEKSVLTVTTEREEEINEKTIIDNRKLVEKLIESPTVQKEDFKLSNTNVKLHLKELTYLPQIFTALILKLTNKAKESGLTSTPKWKINVTSNISKHSIISRTRHVLTSIVNAESSASKCRRIEDLLAHIDRYPEARHYAIKEGAISTLLRIRQTNNDEKIQGSIRESLAIMGYNDPPTGRGIRILSIDGGGIRGVLVIEMLKKLEELTGKKTHEMFDYICGVSTGAIIATTLGGLKRKSLDEVSDLYKEMSTKVFTQSAIKGTSSLVWSHAYYDTALWEKLLRETIGDKPLIKTNRDPNSPKFSAVSAVVNHERVMAYVFRNYTLPHRIESQYMGSHKHALWEAARASAAAPSYFEEFKHGEYLHQDGGILVNNPCAVAIHEAKQLWPNSSIQCVISFGTGRTPNRISDTDSTSVEVAISSWKEKFYKILDSATDTEAVHTMLNDLLPDHVYFRFNPYLTEMLSMVEIRPEKVSQLEQDARMYIRRNEEKFEKAAMALSQTRSMQQKLLDWITLQKRIAGL